MIIRGANLLSRAAAVFVLLFTVTACGGGGGGGDGFLPDFVEVKLTLRDAQGNKINIIPSGSQATLEVKVDANNNRNLVVEATTTVGTLSPDSDLTNGQGIATFTLDVGVDRGAGTITATVVIEGTTFTGLVNFQIGSSGLRLGYFDDGGNFIEGQIKLTPEGTLSSSGAAQLTVDIVDENGDRVANAEQVSFSSSCISAGQASLSPASPVLSSNGQATTQYTAAGCAGSDTITASLGGSGTAAFVDIEIGAAGANRIVFESADPQLIVLRGTGGTGAGDGDLRVETSEVTFQTVDRNGAPLQNIVVQFDLSTTVGGLSIAPASAVSDAGGLVRATVQAGDVATSVRVIATAGDGSGGEVSTVSGLITVTTGLPDQNSISIGVETPDEGGTFVVKDGFGVNGILRTVTVRMADKFNNPVVDGTTAIFTTEYGAIEPSCQTGLRNGELVGDTPASGQCSVVWASQDPRFPTLTGSTFVRTIFDADYSCPSHNGSFGPCPDDLGWTRGGRSTILVHAIGEESFVDSNGNGTMDEAERDLFDNQPEAFVDHNEDGIYTPALPACEADPFGSPQCIAGAEEIFVDFNDDQDYDFNDDPAVYNGLLCPPEGDGVWCSRDLINVRDSVVITMSANPDYDIVVVDEDGDVVPEGFDLEEGEDYTVYVSDIFNNPPPGGTVITLSTTGDCAVTPTSATVPENIYFPGAFEIFPTNVDGDGADDGTLTIDVGGEYSEIYDCDTDAPPDPCAGPSPLPPECGDPNAP